MGWPHRTAPWSTVDLTAIETDQTIVPAGPGVEAVTYRVWTFDGTAPGPVIRVKLGDTIHFRLPPGTYFFRCDVHPTQMTGTFMVK
jgi:hypothetical protein